MAHIFHDSNDNEDIEFANKEWNKLNRSLEKDGLKDGIHEGRESGLQKGFDFGFKQSFEPFFIISSFEAIIDVLSFKLKNSNQNEEISPQMETIKSNIKQLYELTEKHLLSLETNKLKSNTIELNEEIITLFESTKQITTQICNHFNFKTILNSINILSISADYVSLEKLEIFN